MPLEVPREYSAEQVAHGQHPVGAMEFVTTSTFWFQSFQNWQSEFVAVGSIVALTIYLRQRGVARIEACRCSSPRNGWIAAKRASFGSG